MISVSLIATLLILCDLIMSKYVAESITVIAGVSAMKASVNCV